MPHKVFSVPALETGHYIMFCGLDESCDTPIPHVVKSHFRVARKTYYSEASQKTAEAYLGLLPFDSICDGVAQIKKQVSKADCNLLFFVTLQERVQLYEAFLAQKGVRPIVSSYGVGDKNRLFEKRVVSPRMVADAPGAEGQNTCSLM